MTKKCAVQERLCKSKSRTKVIVPPEMYYLIYPRGEKKFQNEREKAKRGMSNG